MVAVDEPLAQPPLETYVEAGRTIAGGRWHVYDGDVVRYEASDGVLRDAVVNATTLRNDPGWRLTVP